MGLRQRMYELRSVEEVDQFLRRFPTSVFFKAGSCHKTMQGFGYVEQALNKCENIHLGLVRVVECRLVSNYIAEITGVVHQSPQFILMVDQKAVFDLDNWNITLETLEQGLSQFVGQLKEEVTKTKVNTMVSNSDVSNYIKLLQKFVNTEVNEEDFEKNWLMTFQSDGSLRSLEEFDLLNGLFGDVDEAISKKVEFSAKGPDALVNLPREDSLQVRAQKLLNILRDPSGLQ